MSESGFTVKDVPSILMRQTLLDRELVKVVVTSPSGSVELDEEARRAFQVAAPFPNPPDGLVQKDNLITFAFGFYFQLGAQHLQWRLPQAM